jgi:amidase
LTDLARMDATAQAELVSSGEATPSELVDAAIGRIEKLNPEINAVIHDLSEEGREAARGALPDGPFKGVPFLLKDIGAAFAGQPFHLGMQVLKDADFRAPMDSFLAQRFREAGLVTIGKTNVPELGILPTTEPDAYGATKNPWNTGHSAGGSSGGAAAAVASGMVPMAHANDGGGSIRIPAAQNGLVGLKPTRQRITEGPLIGDVQSGLTAELVVSKSVRDTAAILEAVEGGVLGDPYAATPKTRPYTEELDTDPKGLRIGYSTTPAVDFEVDPACIEAVEKTARLLESLGHEVSEGSPMDAAAAMRGSVDLEDTFMTRWAAGQASTLDTLSMALGREIAQGDVEPLTWALAEIGRERSAGKYLQDVGLHHGLTRMIAGWYLSGFDLLLTPTTGRPPQPLGSWDDSGDDPLDAFHAGVPEGAFTAIFNITGQPAISLPLGEADGLPVGIQLVAAQGREDLLIQVAAQLERAEPWVDRVAPTFAG